MRVLVVGAGPSGLTAALALARGGAEVHMREQEPDLSSRSLAATFHPPTLEILDDLGVDLTGQGRRVETIEYRRGDDRIEFNVGELADATRFPYRLHLPQLDLCRLLLAELTPLPNADLRFGETALPPAPPGYDHVIAADGAGSRWREAAGIGLNAEPYEGQVTRLICDDDFDSFAGVTYVFTPEDSVSVLRMAGSARVILRTSEETDLPELIERAQTTLGRRLTVHAWSSYRARRATAEHNLSGNLVIIGDAGHQTNTRGGMNMNAGIHDAAGIAAAILDGDPEQAAARRLRVWTDQLLPRTHATLGAGRFDQVAAIADDPHTRYTYLLEASMLDMVP